MEELRRLKHLVAKTDATPGFCGGCGSLDARSHAIFVSIWFPIRSTAAPKDARAALTTPRVRQMQLWKIILPLVLVGFFSPFKSGCLNKLFDI